MSSIPTLFHGDAVHVLPQLEIRPQLIVTSPPYDALRDYGGHGFDFDSMADVLISIMDPGAVLVWVVGDGHVDGSETGTSFRQALGFMERGLRLHDTMIFQKGVLGNVTRTRYYQAFEFMFVLTQGEPATVNLLADRPNVTAGKVQERRAMGRGRDGEPIAPRPGTHTVPEVGRRTNVWRYHVGHIPGPDSPLRNQHPAVYPDALARDHILTWTNPGDLVLDPMAGSGTTLLAAMDVGRNAVGVEIHEPYLDIFHQRLAIRQKL